MIYSKPFRLNLIISILLIIFLIISGFTLFLIPTEYKKAQSSDVIENSKNKFIPAQDLTGSDDLYEIQEDSKPIPSYT